MEYTVTALLPIFLLILIGYFFKYIKFPSNNFWENADKLTYYVLMPSLLIYKLSTAKFDLLSGFNFVVSGLIGILFILFILLIINKNMKIENSSFTSVVQGSIRFNTYVFLALSASLFGDEGLILSALLIAFVIPLINVICITIFAVYIRNNSLTIKNLIKSVLTNPLIIACFVGGSIGFLELNVPIIIQSTLKIVSSSALPMGLLSIGVGLEIKGLKDTKVSLFLSSFLKLIILPILMYIIGSIFQLEQLLLSVLIIFAALPTAPSSFIFARQLGGDIKLMSSIITLQTLLSLFTLSIIIHMLPIF